MSMLRLTLLGPPRVERAGQPVGINRRKSLALLSYLAASSQAHSRDTLATLFWPDVPQRRARGNLRRALSDLNQVIGEGVLLLNGETVALDSENGLWSDVAQFRANLAACAQHPHTPEETCSECLPLLAEAVNLYQADFLAGFTLRDTTEFDDWQSFEAGGLRQDYAATLARLVNVLIEQGDYQAAIAHARRWVALDRFYELAQQQLMLLYALSGRRHEALRQYQSCVEALEAELGIAPSPETEALYQRIVSGDVSPAPVASPKPAWLPPAPTAVEVERSAPLVGRERELETLLAQIKSSWQGQGQTILLAGNAGVGKTRLAYEILQMAAQSGMTTLLGAAYEQEGRLAYHPFIEAIDRYLVEQQHPAEQNPITYYKPLGATDAQQELTALFRATATFFSQLAAHGPVLLLLDDLHAADEASLSMFHYLVRQTRMAPVVLLATYRTDVPINGISPFGSLLNALYREQLSDTITLAPLPAEAGARLINHTLAGPAETQLVETVLDTAEGNPFYVQEICRAMLKANALVRDEERWQLRPGAAVHIPSGLQELLRERAQRLGKTVESALGAAAVVGREFRFAVLRELTGLFDGDLFDALDAALSAQLLEETEEGYRFQHSLIRHTLYDSLSRRHRAWLHARAAEAMEVVFGQSGRLREHVEALAHHYELSDRRELALPYLLEAAEKAAGLFALEIASDYLQRAVTLMDELGTADPARRWPILEQLGNWAKVLADTGQAIACYEQALALTPTPTWQPSPGDRVRVHRSLARTFIAAGRMVEAEGQLQAAMAMLSGPEQASLDYANILYDMALWYWHNDAYQDAFTAAQQSLAIAEQLDDNRARAQAYEMLALACHSLGEWQQGLNFEQQRSTLIGPSLDVTEAFDAHL
ncbi:MAG: AAA family ATPase [Anaerolineae bacterium]|nr:AAA family ATPase [Anaerolineae bacterium]